jgi:hypothetical protein
MGVGRGVHEQLVAEVHAAGRQRDQRCGIPYGVLVDLTAETDQSRPDVQRADFDVRLSRGAERR